MKMDNSIKKYSGIIFMLILITNIYGCDERITDFGFDGEISGLILDQSDNIVSGDVTSAAFAVHLLGEDETEPTRIRVLGDGSYTNSHLYPQIYTIWVEGPVETDEGTVDLTGSAVQQNITVTPFLTIPPPESVGSPTSNDVTISYSITENLGHVAEERIAYVSTVTYPSQSTGNGPYWHTIQQSLEENQDNVTITGLEAGTKYHIRIAARAEGTSQWNHSDQIIIETP